MDKSKRKLLHCQPTSVRVRAMVVAAHKGSYGFTEKTVAVKKPLMVLATMPRVLSPGENNQIARNRFCNGKQYQDM